MRGHKLAPKRTIEAKWKLPQGFQMNLVLGTRCCRFSLGWVVSCRNLQRCIASRRMLRRMSAQEAEITCQESRSPVSYYVPWRAMIFIIYYSSIMGPVRALAGPKSLLCQYETTEDGEKSHSRRLCTPLPSPKNSFLGTECFVCHFPCAVVQFITKARPRPRAVPCIVLPVPLLDPNWKQSSHKKLLVPS